MSRLPFLRGSARVHGYPVLTVLWTARSMKRNSLLPVILLAAVGVVARRCARPARTGKALLLLAGWASWSRSGLPARGPVTIRRVTASTGCLRLCALPWRLNDGDARQRLVAASGRRYWSRSPPRGAQGAVTRALPCASQCPVGYEDAAAIVRAPPASNPRVRPVLFSGDVTDNGVFSRSSCAQARPADRRPVRAAVQHIGARQRTSLHGASERSADPRSGTRRASTKYFHRLGVRYVVVEDCTPSKSPCLNGSPRGDSFAALC
jgi:hypothetical protein